MFCDLFDELCRCQFHKKHPLDLKGAKTLPRDNHCVQKRSLGSQKPNPWDIKLENFTNVSIQALTLFEMESIVVSRNKNSFSMRIIVHISHQSQILNA